MKVHVVKVLMSEFTKIAQPLISRLCSYYYRGMLLFSDISLQLNATMLQLFVLHMVRGCKCPPTPPPSLTSQPLTWRGQQSLLCAEWYSVLSNILSSFESAAAINIIWLSIFSSQSKPSRIWGKYLASVIPPLQQPVTIMSQLL